MSRSKGSQSIRTKSKRGRKKGSKNKSTILREMQQMQEEEFQTPIEDDLVVTNITPFSQFHFKLIFIY